MLWYFVRSCTAYFENCHLITAIPRTHFTNHQIFMEISVCFHEQPYEGIATILHMTWQQCCCGTCKFLLNVTCNFCHIWIVGEIFVNEMGQRQIKLTLQSALSLLMARLTAWQDICRQSDNEASVQKWVFMIWILVQQLGACVIYSLWPMDAIQQHRSGSTLVQVMAWCLMAPCHYLNQCWLIISGFVWHSYKDQYHKMYTSYQFINKANLRDLIAATGLVILLKLDFNRRFFSPCDLEFWWMTPKNNRAPLLCYFKLFASFRSHWWIQTGVTVRKRLIWVIIDAFWAVWPWNLMDDLQKQ